MCRILAIANAKGGVGKTTATANLAAALTARGRKVLAVDLDPQASLTVALGLKPDELSRTIAYALDGQALPLTAILQWTPEGFDLVPANHTLYQAIQESKRYAIPIGSVRMAVEPLRDRYDYILLDCPANAGILTGMALAAADEVIIPTTLDYLSFRALQWFLFIIRQVRETVNPDLRVSGIFYSMVDSRTRHAREMASQIQSTYGAEIPIFSTTVRQSVGLKEATGAGKTILQYAPDSVGAQSYRALAQEIDGGIQETSENELYFAMSGGQAALARGDHPSAYAAFCRATSLNPKLAGAWVGRADSASEWDEQIRCYARALQLDPLRQPVRVSLEKILNEKISSAVRSDIPELVSSAHLLAEVGQESYARNLFQRVIDLDPTHEAAWLGLARTTPDAKAAVDYVQKCLTMNPASDLARAALTAAQDRVKDQARHMVEEASRVMRSGNRAQAHALFRQAVELDSQSDQAWLGCAKTTNDLQAAFGFAKRALDINPQNDETQRMYRYLWEPRQTSSATSGGWWRRLLPHT